LAKDDSAGLQRSSFQAVIPGWYGFVDILCGLIGGVVAIGRLPLDHPPAWFGLMASAFIIVRGAGNISLAVAEKEARSEKG
jgi:hypothetical protein